MVPKMDVTRHFRVDVKLSHAQKWQMWHDSLFCHVFFFITNTQLAFHPKVNQHSRKKYCGKLERNKTISDRNQNTLSVYQKKTQTKIKKKPNRKQLNALQFVTFQSLTTGFHWLSLSSGNDHRRHGNWSAEKKILARNGSLCTETKTKLYFLKKYLLCKGTTSIKYNINTFNLQRLC